MHEYSIVASLVERVQREVDVRPGALVRRVHVRIGEFAGVEIELLRTAFELFRERTVCDGAEIAIDRVPADYEIILERIEMEVPDV